MKSELAEVCVPVMHHIHAQHTLVEEGFDVEYGKGLKMYNNASKELEGGSLREYEEIVEGYEEIRVGFLGIRVFFGCSECYRETSQT
jgi:hypothetical protein